MNKTAGHMEGETQEPQYEENYRNGIKYVHRRLISEPKFKSAHSKRKEICDAEWQFSKRHKNSNSCSEEQNMGG